MSSSAIAFQQNGPGESRQRNNEQQKTGNPSRTERESDKPGGRILKTSPSGGEPYFRTEPPCPAFWGVAPRTMKIGLGVSDLESYFRTKPSCHAFGGVTPRTMKIRLGVSSLAYYFRTKYRCLVLRGEMTGGMFKSQNLTTRIYSSLSSRGISGEGLNTCPGGVFPG
jgi:hypothetical protein